MMCILIKKWKIVFNSPRVCHWPHSSNPSRADCFIVLYRPFFHDNKSRIPRGTLRIYYRGGRHNKTIRPAWVAAPAPMTDPRAGCHPPNAPTPQPPAPRAGAPSILIKNVGLSSWWLRIASVLPPYNARRHPLARSIILCGVYLHPTRKSPANGEFNIN